MGPKFTSVFQSLFRHKDSIDRHLAAPMLREREAYLAHLIEVGHNRKFVTERAWMLCHVARLSRPTGGERINEGDINAAAWSWLSEFTSSSSLQKRSRPSQFKAVARSWYRFLGLYEAHASLTETFMRPLRMFQAAMAESGYLQSSVRSCSSSVRSFLVWVSRRCESISAICLQDVDAFFVAKRELGIRHRTVVSYGRSLRAFFRYAEQQGWSNTALSKTIKTPTLREAPGEIQFPSWRTVRRMLRDLDDADASQCRAKAILLLASVYGLRRSEIVRLTLDDLDWRNEVLTVRRSKGGKVQQFPLQREVGDALIRYLTTVRQRSRFREVFLTLHAPPRPAVNLGPAMRKILSARKVCEGSVGLHALRHACATELLRKGTSLREIAAFLGHRSLDSVSIYAHCSPKALRAVAAFDLGSVL